jgi:hypothetical protein
MKLNKVRTVCNKLNQQPGGLSKQQYFLGLNYTQQHEEEEIYTTKTSEIQIETTNNQYSEIS